MWKIEILKIPNTEWKIYKLLRLEAIKNDSTSFWTTYKEELQEKDEKFAKILEKANNEDWNILLFAKINNIIIWMVWSYWLNKERYNHIATISWIYVRKEFRWLWIWKMLMNEVINRIISKDFIKK